MNSMKEPQNPYKTCLKPDMNLGAVTEYMSLGTGNKDIWPFELIFNINVLHLMVSQKIFNFVPN